MERSLGRSTLLATALFFCGLPAQAVLLDPGDFDVALPGTTSAAEPHLAGVVLVDEIIPFSFLDLVSGGLIEGEVQQRVVRSSVDGTIDFHWRVFNDPSSDGAIGSFRVGEFVSPEYNANYRTDGLGDRGPDTADRFAGTFESYVNFNFFRDLPDPGLLPGESSFFFFLDTTATNFARTAIFDVANVPHTSASDLFDAYAPAAPIPEPGTLGLLGLGLARLLWARRRRAE